MKKRAETFLLALLMMITVLPFTAHAADGMEINEKNFPDEVFRRYVCRNIDTNGDGSLSAEEIAAVKSIDVSYYSMIADLKGMEYFTALTNLNCDQNQLTSLDVSKNTALTYLACIQNKLTSLDVSRNVALEWLVCYDNQLTSLDMKKNVALEKLDCNGNLLTSLDVSKNTALGLLRCSNNQLTSLDVNKNTKLSHLVCSYNRLASLDLDHSIIYVDEQYQSLNFKAEKTSGGWAVDLSALVGTENLNKVEIKPEQGWQYDAATDIAFYSGQNMPVELIYYYHGDNIWGKGTDVTVKLTQQCVVMMENAKEAYVSGTVYPTTQYAAGYAKMENINGTMQMPLRYIAEVDGLTVYYDENTGKTRVTNPADGTYLLITLGSKTVTKHWADGTLISSSEAPLPFTMQNGVTMGPLRYTCEALGLSVFYKETSHGNYVVVSPDVKTDTQAQAKIEEAYQLGL